jgi:hypothetical protein
MNQQEKGTLHFFCAHDATPVQRTLARELGYESVISHPVVFGRNPEKEIQLYTREKSVAIVAPTYVMLDLLRQGYTLIEFENMSSKRRYFLCSGAWVHHLHSSEFIDSPIPLGEQEEILIRNPRRKDGKSRSRSKMGRIPPRRSS